MDARRPRFVATRDADGAQIRRSAISRSDCDGLMANQAGRRPHFVPKFGGASTLRGAGRAWKVERERGSGDSNAG